MKSNTKHIGRHKSHKRHKVRKSQPQHTVVVAIAGIMLAIVIAAGLFLIWNNTQTPSVPVVISKPGFTFDTSRAPGWWSGGNNWPEITEYSGTAMTEADLPIADMTVIKGSLDAPGECFVVFFYMKGSIDIQVTLEDRKEGLALGGGESSSVEQVGSSEQSFQTHEGIKEYTLYQYNVAGPESMNIQRGNEFGFIPLSNGYVEIRGVCATGDQLGQTVPVISAVSLK